MTRFNEPGRAKSILPYWPGGAPGGADGLLSEGTGRVLPHALTVYHQDGNLIHLHILHITQLLQSRGYSSCRLPNNSYRVGGGGGGGAISSLSNRQLWKEA